MSSPHATNSSISGASPRETIFFSRWHAVACRQTMIFRGHRLVQIQGRGGGCCYKTDRHIFFNSVTNTREIIGIFSKIPGGGGYQNMNFVPILIYTLKKKCFYFHDFSETLKPVPIQCCIFFFFFTSTTFRAAKPISSVLIQIIQYIQLFKYIYIIIILL